MKIKKRIIIDVYEDGVECNSHYDEDGLPLIVCRRKMNRVVQKYPMYYVIDKDTIGFKWVYKDK